jgi:hypothetical protein
MREYTCKTRVGKIKSPVLSLDRVFLTVKRRISDIFPLGSGPNFGNQETVLKVSSETTRYIHEILENSCLGLVGEILKSPGFSR